MMKLNFMEKLLDGVEVEWALLGKIADLNRGRVMSKEYLIENKGNYPVFSSQTANNGMIGSINTFDFDGEYVNWTTDGANAGTVFYRTGKFSITNVSGLIKLRNNSKLNYKFLFHWLSIEAKKHVYSGMGNPKLMSHQVEKIPIPIPPLKVQEEIVRILDTFKELTAEVIAELTAELTAHKKQYTYYRDNLLTFKEDEVEWMTLGEVCSIGVGQSPNDIGIGEYPFVNAGTTPSGYLSNFNTEPDTITTPSRGQGGIGFVGYQNSHFWCGPLCYRIRSTCKSIKTRFIYYVMSNSMVDIIGLANMTGVPALNRKELILFKIPIPCLTEQERIVSILDKFDALTTSITEGLPREIELRQKQYEYYRNMLLSFSKEEVED